MRPETVPLAEVLMDYGLAASIQAYFESISNPKRWA